MALRCAARARLLSGFGWGAGFQAGRCHGAGGEKAAGGWSMEARQRAPRKEFLRDGAYGRAQPMEYAARAASSAVVGSGLGWATSAETSPGAAGTSAGATGVDFPWFRSTHLRRFNRNMRYMMIVKASRDSEAGVMPSEELLSVMGKYNEELAKAGVLVDLSGLKPSSQGFRIQHSGGKRTVTDGPFAETKELIAGYWVINVKTRE